MSAPNNVVVKYQLDFATMLKGILEQAYAAEGVSTRDLMFQSYGAYHEFTVHVGAAHHPDVKIIIKAMPEGS